MWIVLTQTQTTYVLACGFRACRDQEADPRFDYRTTTVTITSLSTSTVESTSTSTVTATTTSVATATATASAADGCAINNFADADLGVKLTGFVAADGEDAVQADATSATTCCMAAFNDPSGQSTVWTWQFTRNLCFYATDPTTECANQAANPETAGQLSSGGQAVVGNGPCGEVIVAVPS